MRIVFDTNIYISALCRILNPFRVFQMTRVVMDAKLKKITFSDIKIISHDKAEVVTDEIWDYTYLSIDSSKPLFDNSITYKLKYILEKRSNRWLVADIIIEKADEKKKSQDIFHRPLSRNAPGDKKPKNK